MVTQDLDSCRCTVTRRDTRGDTRPVNTRYSPLIAGVGDTESDPAVNGGTAANAERDSAA